MLRKFHIRSAAGFVLLATLLGCQTDNPVETVETTTEPETTSQRGGVAHSHDHGPHGGEILHLSPSGVHVEWTHDDASQMVKVYLDDFDVDKLVAAKFISGTGETQEEFALEAGDDGWTIKSDKLIERLHGGNITLIVTDDAGDHSTVIGSHDHEHR